MTRAGHIRDAPFCHRRNKSLLPFHVELLPAFAILPTTKNPPVHQAPDLLNRYAKLPRGIFPISARSLLALGKNDRYARGPPFVAVHAALRYSRKLTPSLASRALIACSDLSTSTATRATE